nr:MAG TPA: hypothetical protein [Caudoviricetes sp.]
MFWGDLCFTSGTDRGHNADRDAEWERRCLC